MEGNNANLYTTDAVAKGTLKRGCMVGKQDEMNKHFERAIRINPEMYGWEYKKFRKLPGSKTNIY